MEKEAKKKIRKHLEFPFEYLIPLIAVITVIPLFVSSYPYRTGLDKYEHILAPSVALDFFLHTKMLWLSITFLFILFILIFRILLQKEKPVWNPIFIPFFLYGFFCILSTFFSISHQYSLTGSYEQFEPVWMLLGYVLLTYYAFFTIHSETMIRILIPFFNAGVTLMSLLGLLQISGNDPYYFPAFQKLFLHNPELVGKLTSVFEKGRTYLSLYNPNYVSYYVILILPILFALLFHTKKTSARIFYSSLIFAQLLILLASRSRAGIFVFCLLCFLSLIYLKKYLSPHALLFTGTGILFFCAVSILCLSLWNHKSFLSSFLSAFPIEKTNQDLESIVTDQDVTITYKGNRIHFSIDETLQFSITDDDRKPVPYTLSHGKNPNRITDSRFPFSFDRIDTKKLRGFWIKIPKYHIIQGKKVKTTKQWTFSNCVLPDDHSYYYVSRKFNKFFHLKIHRDSIRFLETYGTLANMRGFIWARTIPLLKKYFFLGSGPDTFLLAFPNDDLVGLMNGNHDNEVITKPHCLYLQIGVQTGIPSLLCFLLFFLWYIRDSFQRYREQDFSKLLPKIGIGILAGTIGYLLLGLTNDSCIAVSPVFYALTGIGLGIQRNF